MGYTVPNSPTGESFEVYEPTPGCITVATSPWARRVVDYSTRPYSGSHVELFRIIMKQLGWCYYMAHSADNKLGNSVNGNYTGAVGMVQREEADMVMGPLALNIRRRDVLEYSYGYIYSKTSMLYRRNTHTQPDVFTLIKPFEPKVWLGVLLAVMFVAGAAIFFNRFHATLRHDTVSGASNQRSTDSEFVAKSILWTWKIFFAQDLTDSPRGHSGHVLTIFWLVISFMIASMYRCNLRAILIDEVKAPFTNTKEFVERDDYTVTWIKGKAYKPYLKERLQWFPDEPLGKLWHMRTDPVSAENFVSTVANNKIAGLAINLALRAFTADDFSQHGECRVAVAESDVVTVYMSYGFPRHSILRESVDSVLLRLVQSGIPEQMQRNNTRNADLCFKPQTSKESRPIAVKDLMGTFLICGIGLTFGVMAFLLELAVHRSTSKSRRTAADHKALSSSST